jgi:hypothetical protein
MISVSCFTRLSMVAVSPPVAVPTMSAIGPKRTSLVAPHMSAFGGKADMTIALRNVRL